MGALQESEALEERVPGGVRYRLEPLPKAPLWGSAPTLLPPALQASVAPLLYSLWRTIQALEDRAWDFA